MKTAWLVLLLVNLPLFSQEVRPPVILAETEYLGPHKVPSWSSTRAYPGVQSYFTDGHDFRIDISVRVADTATFMSSAWGVVLVLPDRSVNKYYLESGDLHQGVGQHYQHSFYIRIREGGWMTVFLAPVKEMQSDLNVRLYTGTSNRESHFLYIPKELELD